MAHDFVIDNAPGASVRSDVNSALQTLAGQSVGTEPTTKYPGQPWWDSANGLMKVRNFTNTAWVVQAAWNGATWTPYRDGTAIGTASTKNTGTAEGNVPLLGVGGVLPSGVVPAPASLIPIGAMWFFPSRTEPTGWLFCNGRTIGDDATNATLEGDYLWPLFEFIWNETANAENQVWDEVTTPGTPIARTRNITAIADWNAGRTISLFKMNGRVPVGLDDMGSAAAGIITSASTGGGNAVYTGGRGGTDTHTLTNAQMPSHTHSYTAMDVDGNGNVDTVSFGSRDLKGKTTGSAGSGQAHSNTQPWLAGSWIIKW